MLRVVEYFAESPKVIRNDTLVGYLDVTSIVNMFISYHFRDKARY